MPNTDKHDFQNTPILVIDDKDLNRTILDMQLKSVKLKPVFTGRAHKAIEILKLAQSKNQTIPVVICDFYMPDMNGLDLVQTLKNIPGLSNTKVIFLASQNLGDKTQQLVQMGVAHILPQPSSIDSLIEAISECLRASANEIDAAKPKYTDKSDVKILAADDDPINLAVLKGFLNLAGYSVDTVKDGVDAVKACNDIAYDLVLMDICMPTMDGVIATLQIRTNEKRANKKPVPIVAVTAHYSTAQKKRYLEAGMNQVMSKPIRRDLIDACLQEWCPRFPDSDKVERLMATG